MLAEVGEEHPLGAGGEPSSPGRHDKDSGEEQDPADDRRQDGQGPRAMPTAIASTSVSPTAGRPIEAGPSRTMGTMTDAVTTMIMPANATAARMASSRS
jgi:hypothetical protein